MVSSLVGLGQFVCQSVAEIFGEKTNVVILMIWGSICSSSSLTVSVSSSLFQSAFLEGEAIAAVVMRET